MSLLETLLADGEHLVEAILPSDAQLRRVVAALVARLEQTNVLEATKAPAPQTAASEAAANAVQPEPVTAPPPLAVAVAPDVPPPADPAPLTVDELDAQIAKLTAERDALEAAPDAPPAPEPTDTTHVEQPEESQP